MPTTDATKEAQLKRRRADWIREAACRAHEARLWDADNPDGWRRARLICSECPVARNCYGDAIGDPMATGLYAGVLLLRGKPDGRRPHRSPSSKPSA